MSLWLGRSPALGELWLVLPQFDLCATNKMLDVGDENTTCKPTIIDDRERYESYAIRTRKHQRML